MEWTLGLEANSFGGAGSGNLKTGVGPVFGFAFMPTKRLEVTALKGAIDHHGRYRIESGLSFYFNDMGATLKDLRRRYLEPNFGGPNSAGGIARSRPLGCFDLGSRGVSGGGGGGGGGGGC